MFIGSAPCRTTQFYLKMLRFGSFWTTFCMTVQRILVIILNKIKMILKTKDRFFPWPFCIQILIFELKRDFFSIYLKNVTWKWAHVFDKNCHDYFRFLRDNVPYGATTKFTHFYEKGYLIEGITFRMAQPPFHSFLKKKVSHWGKLYTIFPTFLWKYIYLDSFCCMKPTFLCRNIPSTVVLLPYHIFELYLLKIVCTLVLVY